MTLLSLLGLMAFVVLAVTALEQWRNPGPSEWRINLLAWVINLSIALFVMQVLPSWRGGSLIDAAALPLWLSVPVFFIVQDFFEWFYHLAQHRVPALWAIHSVHHSDTQMTALTTNRHFWGDALVKQLTIWSATTMVIRGTETLATIYAVVSVYNYFIHANLKVDFGRFSWLLNCPAYHRRHHSRLPEHYDCNLAAMFPIWDVLYGTYRRPDGWPPCGLAEGRPDTFAELVTWPWRRHKAAARPEAALRQA